MPTLFVIFVKILLFKFGTLLPSSDNKYKGKTDSPPLLSERIYPSATILSERKKYDGLSGVCLLTIKQTLLDKNGIYRGLITCKECGCSMTPEPHNRTQKNGNVHNWLYYHCTGSKGKHKSVWIEEKELTKQFADIYKHMEIPNADLEHMTKTLKEAHVGKINFNSELFDGYNLQIKKYQNRIEKLYDDKYDGSITQEEYDNLRKRYRKEQQEYVDKLASLHQADEQYYITASMLLDLASRSYDLFMGSETDEKREIIQLTLQNLFINDGKLEYTLQKPFDSIFKSALSLEWGS